MKTPLLLILLLPAIFTVLVSSTDQVAYAQASPVAGDITRDFVDYQAIFLVDFTTHISGGIVSIDLAQHDGFRGADGFNPGDNTVGVSQNNRGEHQVAFFLELPPAESLSPQHRFEYTVTAPGGATATGLLTLNFDFAPPVAGDFSVSFDPLAAPITVEFAPHTSGAFVTIDLSQHFGFSGRGLNSNNMIIGDAIILNHPINENLLQDQYEFDYTVTSSTEAVANGVLTVNADFSLPLPPRATDFKISFDSTDTSILVDFIHHTAGGIVSIDLSQHPGFSGSDGTSSVNTVLMSDNGENPQVALLLNPPAEPLLPQYRFDYTVTAPDGTTDNGVLVLNTVFPPPEADNLPRADDFEHDFNPYASRTLVDFTPHISEDSIVSIDLSQHNGFSGSDGLNLGGTVVTIDRDGQIEFFLASTVEPSEAQSEYRFTYRVTRPDSTAFEQGTLTLVTVFPRLDALNFTVPFNPLLPTNVVDFAPHISGGMVSIDLAQNVGFSGAEGFNPDDNTVAISFTMPRRVALSLTNTIDLLSAEPNYLFAYTVTAPDGSSVQAFLNLTTVFPPPPTADDFTVPFNPLLPTNLVDFTPHISGGVVSIDLSQHDGFSGSEGFNPDDNTVAVSVNGDGQIAFSLTSTIDPHAAQPEYQFTYTVTGPDGTTAQATLTLDTALIAGDFSASFDPRDTTTIVDFTPHISGGVVSIDLSQHDGFSGADGLNSDNTVAVSDDNGDPRIAFSLTNTIEPLLLAPNYRFAYTVTAPDDTTTQGFLTLNSVFSEAFPGPPRADNFTISLNPGGIHFVDFTPHISGGVVSIVLSQHDGFSGSDGFNPADNTVVPSPNNIGEHQVAFFLAYSAASSLLPEYRFLYTVTNSTGDSDTGFLTILNPRSFLFGSLRADDFAVFTNPTGTISVDFTPHVLGGQVSIDLSQHHGFSASEGLSDGVVLVTDVGGSPRVAISLVQPTVLSLVPELRFNYVVTTPDGTSDGGILTVNTDLSRFPTPSIPGILRADDAMHTINLVSPDYRVDLTGSVAGGVVSIDRSQEQDFFADDVFEPGTDNIRASFSDDGVAQIALNVNPFLDNHGSLLPQYEFEYTVTTPDGDPASASLIIEVVRLPTDIPGTVPLAADFEFTLNPANLAENAVNFVGPASGGTVSIDLSQHPGFSGSGFEPGTDNIVLDNTSGMRAAILHLLPPSEDLDALLARYDFEYMTTNPDGNVATGILTVLNPRFQEEPIAPVIPVAGSPGMADPVTIDFSEHVIDYQSLFEELTIDFNVTSALTIGFYISSGVPDAGTGAFETHTLNETSLALVSDGIIEPGSYVFDYNVTDHHDNLVSSQVELNVPQYESGLVVPDQTHHISGSDDSFMFEIANFLYPIIGPFERNDFEVAFTVTSEPSRGEVVLDGDAFTYTPRSLPRSDSFQINVTAVKDAAPGGSRSINAPLFIQEPGVNPPFGGCIPGETIEPVYAFPNNMTGFLGNDCVEVGTPEERYSDTATITISSDVEVPTGASGSDWKKKPTFGLSWETNSQFVDSGFVFNGIVLDVTDNWHTDFTRTSSIIGDLNTVKIKTYSPNSLDMVSLSLGLEEIGAPLSESDTSIIIDLDPNYENDLGFEVAGVSHVQSEDGLVDESRTHVEASKAACSASDAAESCFLFEIDFTVQAPLMGDVVAITAVDRERRTTTTYVNEGVVFTGEQLLAPLEHTIHEKTTSQDPAIIKLLTRDDRVNDIWSDQDGYLWIKNSHDTWFQLTGPDYIAPADDPNISIKTRIHSEFADLLQSEIDRAKLVFDGDAIQGSSDVPVAPHRLDPTANLVLEHLSIEEVLELEKALNSLEYE